MNPVSHLPALMRRITTLTFCARSGPGSRMQWNHDGHGTVRVSMEGDDILFDESFTLDNGLPCTDRKCWRFTPAGIVFRHFRQQAFQDILLLVPEPATAAHRQAAAPEGTQSSPRLRLLARAPYACPPDHYDGNLTLDADTLVLTLRITGARKDEHIRYTYRPAP